MSLNSRKIVRRWRQLTRQPLETPKLAYTREQQLDMLIAQHVMDWTCIDGEWRNSTGYQINGPGEAAHDQWGEVAFPRYSTCMADAWQIVEKLSPVEDEFRLTQWERKDWFCTFDYFGATSRVEATTAPLAICLAALAVLGVARDL